LKVTLEKTFPMPAAAEATWGLLQDVGAVAGCMPGATITERPDERHFKGTVAVRFGPANMSFRGEVEVAAIEPATRTLRLIGRGTDTAGGSGASLDLTARVETTDANSSRLIGHSEVSLSGKAAAFGARVADSVAQEVLRQFAANFAAAVQARPASAPSANAPVAGAPVASAGTAPPAAALSGLALLRAVIAGWLRALFGLRGT
jgi:carbon monoxide dehydrogenase subunit G